MILKEGVQLDKRYRLTREIGRGRSGSVWAAYDLGRNEEVAIKFVYLVA